MTITGMAQDQGKKEELKEVFHQLGLSLHTEDELRRIFTEAEACGGAQVPEEYVLHMQAELDVRILQAKARRREAASQGHAEHPVILVASMHQEGEPQSILMSTGEVWGIKISAVSMLLCLNPP